MTSLLVDTSKATGAPTPSRRRAGGGLWTSVRGNPKALIGVIIFAVFVVLAAAPQLFTPVRHPNDLEFLPSLGPSRHHLLGTTALGQDIWAQLVWGTRQSLFVAVVIGALATVLSVLIGVSAAYLGGWADDGLSLMTDVFLVIPTFPLIIVIAAYAGSGSRISSPRSASTTITANSAAWAPGRKTTLPARIGRFA